MTHIELKNLCKDFVLGNQVIHALKDVNLKIKRGEFVSVVGPSGSGKSTFLNMVGAIEKPSKGAMIIDKENIVDYDDRESSDFRREKIGFIFQTFNLLHDLTARENILIPTVPDGIPDHANKRAIKLLEQMDMADRASHKPMELSGGQQQRVAIARALINEPEIILADEPTGELDHKSGNTIIELMKKLNRSEKVTVILVTHDLKVAKMADRIILLDDGKVVLDKPSNRVNIKDLII
ncbi:MAG: ABC transporter ATP-binding protein [Nanoarchaeota archaeon]|nr:ABC transporter ATP-binding protein [Nanoarchaeota archaeon]